MLISVLRETNRKGVCLRGYRQPREATGNRATCRPLPPPATFFAPSPTLGLSAPNSRLSFLRLHTGIAHWIYGLKSQVEGMWPGHDYGTQRTELLSSNGDPDAHTFVRLPVVVGAVVSVRRIFLDCGRFS